MIQSLTKPNDVTAPAQSGAMSDHLVRVNHLKALQKSNDWDDSELARRVGRSPQQVYAWFNGRRPIGEKLARSLEEQLGLSRFALDDRGAVIKAMDNPPNRGVVNSYLPSATLAAREIPIIRWADIAAMIEVENSSLRQKAVHLESYAPSSTRAKFLQMPDDSMQSLIFAGDHVLIDPTEAPRAGDVVLIRVPDGEHFLRTFRPRTAYVFEATAANPAYQPLNSTDDGAVVLGVMIEHRRYRRPA